MPSASAVTVKALQHISRQCNGAVTALDVSVNAPSKCHQASRLVNLGRLSTTRENQGGVSDRNSQKPMRRLGGLGGGSSSFLIAWKTT